MLLEQRMSWLDLEAVCPEVDIVSVGNESCMKPFLKIDKQWNDFLKLIDSELRVKVVLGRVAQSELEDTLCLLQKMLALQRNIEVVLNDWGIIHFCAHDNHLAKIHIGRQLCRSISDCPWYKEIVDNETTEIREIIESHPFSDIDRMRTLRELRIQGLEINSVLSKETVDLLLETEMEIAINCDEYLLTCGRTCLSKRIIKDMSCEKECDQNINIIPSGKWLSYFENAKPFSTYEKMLLKDMSIKGKRVLLPQKMDIKELINCKADVIVTSKQEKINYLRRIIS